MGILVRQCCCGCTLRVGCLIIGIVYLVGTMIQLALTAISLMHIDILSNDPSYDEIKAVLIGAVITNVVFSVSCIVLIIGVHARRRFCLLQWAVIGMILWILNLIFAIIEYSDNEFNKIYTLVAPIITLVLGMYCAIVVYSFAEEIRTEPENTGVQAYMSTGVVVMTSQTGAYPPGQYPPAGAYPPPGQYPPPGGHPPGAYPQAGAYPAGGYPGGAYPIDQKPPPYAAGQSYPQPEKGLPPDQYPPPGTQYPPPGTQYPPPGTQYPPPGTQYPPPGTQYPPPGTQYPPQAPPAYQDQGGPS